MVDVLLQDISDGPVQYNLQQALTDVNDSMCLDKLTKVVIHIGWLHVGV